MLGECGYPFSVKAERRCGDAYELTAPSFIGRFSYEWVPSLLFCVLCLSSHKHTVSCMDPASPSSTPPSVALPARIRTNPFLHAKHARLALIFTVSALVSFQTRISVDVASLLSLELLQRALVWAEVAARGTGLGLLLFLLWRTHAAEGAYVKALQARVGCSDVPRGLEGAGAGIGVGDSACPLEQRAEESRASRVLEEEVLVLKVSSVAV